MEFAVIAVIALAFFGGTFAGKDASQKEIAEQCLTQKTFTVGDSVFTCQIKTIKGLEVKV